MYGTEKENHLGGYWAVKDPGTWGPEIWDKIILDFNIKNVADIGCGLGYSTQYFLEKGLNVIGVEGGENAIKNTIFKGNLIQNDYTKSIAFKEDCHFQFDLIWCCEFVEHVEERYSINFLNDFKSAKYVAMTYASPGQDGYHHVNCQPQKYWINKLMEIGFQYDEEYSEMLKNIAIQMTQSNYNHSGHLTRILFFKKI